MLIQQYLVELMDSGQHSLMPVYACHLRADERREVSSRLSCHKPGLATLCYAIIACLLRCTLRVCHVYHEGKTHG